MDDALKEVLRDWFDDNFRNDMEKADEDVTDLETLLEQEGYEIVDTHKGNR